jgi:glutamyl-tRNA reductase
MLIESQSDVGMLDFLYENALLCSRKIRSTFSNEMKSVSVSGLVLEKVKSMGGTLGEHSLLIIGAGTSATLTAKIFKKHGIGEIFIINRNEKSGMSLSQDVSGSFFKMDDIEKALLNCNVIVAATHSNEYLLHKLQMESVMRKRRDMLLLFDISSPRNMDPSISDIDNVFLHDLDSLKSGNLHEIKEKQVMIKSALQIIDQHSMENLDILGFKEFKTEFSKLQEVSV